MRIEQVKVNKTIALEMLSRNIERNRPISPGRAKRFRTDMTGPGWKRNGETIKFDTAGRLIDGQHRLTAIAQADITVELDVAYDVTEDAVSTIDQGRSRSASDALNMAGFNSAKILAAASKIALNYLEGVSPSYHQTTPSIQAFTEQFPAIQEYSIQANRLFGKIPPSPLAAIVFLASADGTRERMIDPFLDGLATGANLPEGDARLALLQTLGNIKARSAGSKSLDLSYVFHVGARAWNAYCEGRSIAIARYSRDRKKRYIIPDITGAPRAGSGIAALRTTIADKRARAVMASVRGH